MRITRRIMDGAMLLFLASCYFSIAVNSLSLGLMAICWLVLMILERRWSVTSTPYDWFFLAWILSEYLSTAFSENVPQSLLFSKRLLLIAIVYFFASRVTTEGMTKTVVVTLLGTAVAVALLGVGKLLISWFVAGSEEVKRLGIFQFYMTTSELMMIALLLTVPFVVHPHTPRRWRIMSLLAAIPLGVALYATVTRGAYLAAAAGILFIALVRNVKLVVPFLVLVILVLAFAPPYVHDRIASITDVDHPENASRIKLWKAGLKILEHHPVVGVGDIDLREMYDRYSDVENPEHHGHLHNVPLQILATLGILGFAAVYSLFVKIAITEWRTYRRLKDQWFSGSVALGALAVFVGFQVMGLTEWSFGDQEVAILLWITVGLSLAVGRLNAPQFTAQ
jgi:putative inorganic carbon (hco3(-)) transporter